MLQRAIKYKEHIEKFINMLEHEDYLKYWFHSSRCSCGELKIDGDEWNDIHRVSCSKDGKYLYGYFHVSIHRDDLSLSSLSVMNMAKVPNPVIVKDLLQFIDDLLNKYQFNKLSFSVSIGNPAEKQYDRIIERMGGRIVGIKKKDVKLLDGKYYDVKLYEILREDYLKW